MKKHLVSIAAILACLGLSAAETQTLYLSGTGSDSTVDWEFFCTAGRGSGKWTTIPVPAGWKWHANYYITVL